MDFLKRWVGMLKGRVLRMSYCVAGEEFVEHVLFECALYDIQRQKHLDQMKQIFLLEAFKAFNRNSIIDKAVFYLGKNKICWQMMNVVRGIIE